MGDPFHDPFNFLGIQPQHSFEPGTSAYRRKIHVDEDEGDDIQNSEKQGDDYALQYQLEEEKSIQEVCHTNSVDLDVILIFIFFRQLFWHMILRNVRWNRRMWAVKELASSMKNFNRELKHTINLILRFPPQNNLWLLRKKKKRC